ncbi:MAG: polysaccharide biosynthesis tyrosine autokinase [Ferruginibacter sp.]
MREDKNVWEGKVSSSDQGSVSPSSNKTGGFDIDFRRILSAWPFVILFGFLGFLAGSIYLRYAKTEYNVSTSIIMEEKQEVTIGQALFGSARDPFNDRIAYLKSPVLALKLVDSLGLQYNTEAKGHLKSRDFYGLISWFIINKPSDKVPEISFTVDANDKDFTYTYGSETGKVNWGTPFMLKDNKVVVYKIENFTSQSPILCYNSNINATAFKLSKALSITSNKESNIINITYADNSSDRAVDILNGIVKIYNSALELDKTQTFSQAIDFIEGRIAPLGRELDSIENSIARYKSSKGFIGMSANGEIYLQKMQDYDKQLNDINILRSTINNVERFINNPSLMSEDVAFVGITDQGLQSTLKQYQETRVQREKLALTRTENSPDLQLLDRLLGEIRGNMNLQLQSYKNNLLIAQNKYDDNMRTANSLLRNTPMEEKELITKGRMQSIKESLFLALLQKREEAGIQKASVTVNTKVLSSPTKINSVLKPDKRNIILISVIAGLLLPLIFLVIKELLNNKVISKKQLQGLTDIPVIAELEHVDNLENVPYVIEETKRSMFGEQIRSLRTNIDFYIPSNKKSKYILFTSSVSGEGKSFMSMNLAKSYAIQGKKVALLEFDLRRPKISSALSIPKSQVGLSSFLIGKSKLEQIIVHSNEDDKGVLDFFPAGAIPPNPQELISGEYIDDLKRYLDENYEVVIIDTPPYGIVADAQILGEWADVSLILTRFKQTVKEQIAEINDWNKRKVFRKMAIVFNGVKNKGYFGSKYGNYYYKRKYGYSYYSSSKD